MAKQKQLETRWVKHRWRLSSPIAFSTNPFYATGNLSEVYYLWRYYLTLCTLYRCFFVRVNCGMTARTALLTVLHSFLNCTALQTFHTPHFTYYSSLSYALYLSTDVLSLPRYLSKNAPTDTPAFESASASSDAPSYAPANAPTDALPAFEINWEIQAVYVLPDAPCMMLS